jgi:hypothetical protein
MGHTQNEPGFVTRRPWNDGRMVGAKKPLKPKDVWAIRFFLEHEGRLRDRALLDLAIDSKLRGCDVVAIKIGDLMSGGQIRQRATVIQKKTGRPVQFELVEPAHSSLLTWLELRGGGLDDFRSYSATPRSRQPSGILGSTSKTHSFYPSIPESELEARRTGGGAPTSVVRRRPEWGA